MILRNFLLPAALAVLLAACGTPESRNAAPSVPLVLTPPSERADAAVVRRDLPESPVPPIASLAPRPPSAPAARGSTVPPEPIVVPADAIYVCVVDSAGTRRQTVIELQPSVHQLCHRHPEMGPCQYERNACRSAGGRVFAAAGREITMQTETEYDRKVMRARFRAN